MKERLIRTLKRWVLGNRLPVYIISQEPLICIAYWEDYVKNAAAISAVLATRKTAYFLFQLGWHRETTERARELREEAEKYAISSCRFIFLTNSERESELLAAERLNPEFIHQNALVDERRYRIIRAEKKYDAIYIARITPFKRHQLAALIPRLRLIGDHSQPELSYFEKTMQRLSHADWTRKIWGRKVSQAIAQAHTGLCLSAEEGAMFVSIEYLLSGCPVVSTENLGGRNAFFRDDYAVMVKDTPEAVAEGVQAMMRRHPDSTIIREETIRRMETFRQRFKVLIQNIYAQEHVSRPFAEEWPRVFVHKFGLRCPTWTIPGRKFLHPSPDFQAKGKS